MHIKADGSVDSSGARIAWYQVVAAAALHLEAQVAGIGQYDGPYVQIMRRNRR